MADPVQTSTAPRTRLLSLDVARGITIAFMILVNNNGSDAAYWPLKHSLWSGWTPTDLVFPTFLFLVGITIVFSTESRLARGESKRSLLQHVLWRTLVLILLGLVVNGFPHFPLHTLRIYGVLQRIAICYCIAALLYMATRRVAVIASVAVAALIGYWALMRFAPVPGYGVPTHGFPLLDKNINWVAYLDRKIFPHRLYEGVRDPEGLLSDIPALATALFGVLTGLWLRSRRSPYAKLAGLLGAAAAGFVIGKLWGVWFPINKKLWTSSYVFFAGGWTLLLLGVCYWLIEIRKWLRGWTLPWLVFGANAIVVYVFSELFAEVLAAWRVQQGGHSVRLKSVIFDHVFAHILNPSFGSLMYSLAFVAVCFIPAAVLYRKRIFIKV